MVPSPQRALTSFLVGTAVRALRSAYILSWVARHGEWPRWNPDTKPAWSLKADDAPRRLIITWLTILSVLGVGAVLFTGLLVRSWGERRYGRIVQLFATLAFVLVYAAPLALSLANEKPEAGKSSFWWRVILTVGVCLGVGLLGYVLFTVGGSVRSEVLSGLGLIAILLAMVGLLAITLMVIVEGLGWVIETTQDDLEAVVDFTPKPPVGTSGDSPGLWDWDLDRSEWPRVPADDRPPPPS